MKLFNWFWHPNWDLNGIFSSNSRIKQHRYRLIVWNQNKPKSIKTHTTRMVDIDRPMQTKSTMPSSNSPYLCPPRTTNKKKLLLQGKLSFVLKTKYLSFSLKEETWKKHFKNRLALIQNTLRSRCKHGHFDGHFGLIDRSNTFTWSNFDRVSSSNRNGWFW